MNNSCKHVFSRIAFVFCLIILSALTFTAAAQTWQPLGPDDANEASGGSVSAAGLVTDPNGVPYLVYPDGSNGSKATVKMYNGTSWTAVGSPDFSPGFAFTPSLAFNGTTPYVVFEDATNGFRATVMMYNGTAWVTVGAADFSPAQARTPSLAFNGTTPYVAFADANNGNKATVMMFDGTNWVSVGSPDFSAAGADFTTLAFIGSTPYLAYSDSGNSDVATVVMFDGTNWVPVGTPGFSGGRAISLSIVVNGTSPYVVYDDFNNASKATVMMFDGANWVTVGPADFSPGQASNPFLAFNGTTPYIVYADGVNGNKATVMKYNGATWATVGSQGFSAGATTSTALAFSGTTPYAAYTDGTGAVVMMYNGTSWVQVGTSGITGGAASSASLAIQGSTPYVAYADNSNQNKASVMSYNGTGWVHVGAAGLSAGGASLPTLAFNGTTPYVAYGDFAAGGKATVMKYSNSFWSLVGIAGFSPAPVPSAALAFSGTTPYVAFSDGANAGKVTVMKYNGSSWGTLGLPGFSPGQAFSVSLAFSGATPYVAFPDGSNFGKLTIMRYDGANWVLVGAADISSGPAQSPILAFSGTTPYVAYGDGGNGGKVAVMMYNGTSWVPVGGPGISAGSVQSVSFAFSGTTPYVAYPDGGNGNKAAVMLYNGTSWVPAGASALTAGAANSVSLAFNGPVPYLAFTSGGLFVKYFHSTAPTVQASNLIFSGTTGTTTTASWTNGNGASRAVFMFAGSSGSPATADLTAYAANPAFGTGSQIGSTGWYCIYNGTGTTVNITGLTAGTAYQVMAVEYNGTGSNVAYLTTPGSGNPAGLSTVPPPTVSYPSPKVYAVGQPITPLAPTGGNIYTPALGASTLAVTGSTVGLGVDSTGNIYACDPANSKLLMYAPGNSAPVTLYNGAVNGGVGAGNIGSTRDIFFTSNNTVIDLNTVPGASPVNLGLNISGIASLAVNAPASGEEYDVYFADASGQIYWLSRTGGTYSAPVAIANAFTTKGLSVDHTGHLYYIGIDNKIYESTAIHGSASTPAALLTPNPSFSQPSAIAVDVAGNVFVCDQSGSSYILKEIQANSSNIVTICSLPNIGNGMGFDKSGNLYIDCLSQLVKIGPVGGYYVNGSLPAGLAIDSSTGVISGTPTAISPATDYTITAYNGGVSASAIVNIRVASTAANLSSLVLSAGALTPGFSGFTTSYTASVANSTTSIKVTPTAANPPTTITVNGVAVASGLASQSLPLAVGPNIITTVVTAQDGTTTQTYAITVTRAASTNTNLANLKINSGAIALSPAFNYNTTGYTASVTNAMTSIKITPATSDANAAVKINGTTVSSGTASAAIPLSVGLNTITTVVTAQDGTTTKTYTITVTRAPSANASLAGLKLSAGTLSPAFATGTGNYTATVSVAVTSVTLTPTTSDATATVKVNSTTVVSGTASAAIALNTGLNTITTVVTAQDGTTMQTYTVTIGRGASNTNLSNLKINAGAIPLTPAFNYTVTGYTASVPNSTTSVKITPAASDANASINVNGTAVKSGTASAAINLNIGPNTITTVVTAQDGITTKTYTITVTRAASSNAGLAALSLSSGTLSPVFATATTGYTANVTNATTTITVTPTTSDATATVTVNGTAVISGTASASLPLVVGPNAITTIVTAQDGTTTKTYTVTVTRAPSSNANLANLKINSGNIAITPGFNYNTISYTASVTNATASVKVTPAAADANATVKINGATVASGTQSAAIPLSVGSNSVTTVVTAQDGTTTKTYTITVTRATGPIAEPLAAIGVEKQVDSPQLIDDGVIVHRGISPNGDGQNDFLVIDGITNYPDNKLMIMNRNGQLVYETKGYDNLSKVFDGHSNKTGAKQLPGTYFYSLEYSVKGTMKHKTGFIVLKY